MSKKGGANPTSPLGQKIPKSIAIRKAARLQTYTAISLFASAAFGFYLLATDKSLWLLAVSHAYGLLIICGIDAILAVVNLLSIRWAITLTIGWSILTFLLQVADISTASQYHLTMGAFVTYLFGLWAFDALLAVQFFVFYFANSARIVAQSIPQKRAGNYFEMGKRNSRRDFLQIGGTFGALFVIAAVLGIWAQLSPAPSTTTTETSTGSNSSSGLPTGAVANMNSLQIGVPVYFDFPSTGYSNMLIKKSDGSLNALSILCTHVCCTCQYDPSSKELLCPCHGSVFDQNGNVLNGPASVKLPAVQVRIDSAGNIFPVKVIGSSPCVQGS